MRREVDVGNEWMLLRPVFKNFRSDPAPEKGLVQHAFQSWELGKFLLIQIDRMARDKNEWHTRQQGAGVGHKLKAIKLRHVEVGQNHTDIHLLKRLQRFQRPGESEDRTI